MRLCCIVQMDDNNASTSLLAELSRDGGPIESWPRHGLGRPYDCDVRELQAKYVPNLVV